MQNLPNNWGDMELAQLFAQYGSVLECRVLHNGDMTRGAGALVRMSTVQQASAAIEALNNVSNGTGLPLLVRYNHPLHPCRLGKASAFGSNSSTCCLALFIALPAVLSSILVT